MTNNKLGYLKTHFASIIVAACAILLARAAWATTWYVDAATGSSSHSGRSLSDAFASIQTAVDSASAGDTIRINDGTYSPINTRNKSITIESVNGASKTIIDGGNSSRCAMLKTDTVWRVDGNTNTMLVGITLQNGYARESGGGVLGGYLKNCVIRNNRVSQYGGGACSAFLDNCVVEGNINSGQRGGGAFECYCIHCTFRNNSAQVGSATSQCDIFGCIAVGNVATEGGAIHLGDAYNCLIVGNYAPKAAGVYACLTVVNSIIWNNYKTGTTTVCNYEEDYSDYLFCCSEPLCEGFGNICANPKFVDEDNGDFHLKKDSPCVDAAMIIQSIREIPNIGMDADGAMRLQGMGMDMGPYELRQEFNRDFAAHSCWYVDKQRGSDSNSGRDRQHPFEEIFKAIGVACDGDHIYVGDGDYSGISNLGKKLFILSERGPYLTSITAKSSDRCAVPTILSDVSTNLVISGFTIRNGKKFGGVESGTYKNCIFTGNKSTETTSRAGGVSWAHIINCLIYDNECVLSGGVGGVCESWIENCTIVRNRGAKCGGVSKPYSLVNSIVFGNSGGTVNDVYLSANGTADQCCCGNNIAGVGNIVGNLKVGKHDHYCAAQVAGLVVVAA